MWAPFSKKQKTADHKTISVTMGAGLRLELKSVDNESTMLPLHQPAISIKNLFYFAFYFTSLATMPHIIYCTL